MSKVTIAIASYNREQYLFDCLVSIRSQVFRDFEVIVFDNHSEYNIVQLLSQFPDIKPRLEQAPSNLGQDANFLRIYLYSYSSPYVLIFHDDDALHPELLSREVSFMDLNSEAVWVGSKMNFVNNDKFINHFRPLPKSPDSKLYDAAALTREILAGFPLCFDSILYKAEILEDHMGLVRAYSKWSDRPQVITLARKGPVGLINLPLVNYRIHPTRDSAKLGRQPAAQAAQVANFIMFTKRLFGFYKESLPQPLSGHDKSLWLRFTTNNVLAAVYSITSTRAEFMDALKQFSPDFFQWKYLSPKGIFYLLKIFKKFYF